MRLSRALFFAILIIATGTFAAQWSDLPPFVASHFGADGQPNAFMSRSSFVWTMFVPAIVVLVVGLLTPILVGKLPVSLVNLPNKDYWLAPERREESLRRLSERMEWFGVALLVFLSFVYELVFQANIHREPLANRPFIVGLFAFLSFTIVWTVNLQRSFRVTDQHPS